VHCNDIVFHRAFGARGNEEIEEKGKGSDGRGELIARREGGKGLNQ